MSTHVVFTSDGVTTDMFTDGIFRFNYPTPLRMTGNQGIGAATADGVGAFFDVMQGNILGFASYDSALSPAEVAQHNGAFAAVPEPGVVALGLVSLAGLARRRRSVR